MKTNTSPPEYIISENGDWFHFSGYWGVFSRCLCRMGGKFHEAIDVSLTPINVWEWEELKQVRIRKHRTTETNPFAFAHSFPKVHYDHLVEKVGETIARLLVHEDLLAEIDMSLFRHMDRVWGWGGGVPFILVCKERDRYPELLEHWFTVLDNESAYLKSMDEDMMQRYLIHTESCRAKAHSH